MWVQDYQLQLVPGFVRDRRPDLRIGFFNHIPFPAFEIYSRLPWRRQIVEGLLGFGVEDGVFLKGGDAIAVGSGHWDCGCHGDPPAISKRSA